MTAVINAIESAVRSAFISPFFFVFLGLIPIVILLYLLKLRRTEMLISSTMLWRKSLQDLTANAPFQKLRKNLLLLLQVLVLLLLVFALARPFLRSEGVRGHSICLLIDRSASMQVREREATRLELAKREARNIVNDLRGGDKMMIVTFAENSDVLCELTDDRFRLRQAINSIQPSDTRTNIRDALLVAHSLKLTAPDLRLIIVSDGNISDHEELGARAFDLSFLQVGESTNNAGIVSFSTRKPLGGTGECQSFILVHNESSEPLDTTLSLYFNDATLAVEEVHAPPGGDHEVVFAHPDLGSGILRAALDHDDDLPVDDEARLALRPTATIRALLVAESGSTGEYFLKRVMLLDPRVELSAIEPSNYSVTDEYDLTIFNGYAPEELPPGSLLFINAVPPGVGVEAGGTIENPPVLAKDPEHPVMRFLNPANVGIRKAMELIAPEGSRELISTTGGPLLADVSRGGQQILVVAFGIEDSDWPLKLSFPLFVQNLLAWVPRSGIAAETSIITGRPIAIMPVPDVESATVVSPDGSKHAVQIDPLRPVYFGVTERAGVYTVMRGSDVVQHAANLADMNESSIEPEEKLSVGRGEVAAERGRVKQNRELWRLLVIAGICALTVEWWIYSRRAWI